MTNKTELLPCPFCGGPGKLCVADYVHDDGRPLPIVECETCHGWVPADVWNTRAPAEDVRAVVEEPVGYALDNMLKRIKDNPSSGHMIFGSPNGGYDIPLYRRPQRPVVLPERIIGQQHGDKIAEAEQRGWNACLDAVEELNK